ncbi:MAG: hypothetical protein ACRC92_04120 [Peptostreptococcaceae bacterium]
MKRLMNGFTKETTWNDAVTNGIYFERDRVMSVYNREKFTYADAYEDFYGKPLLDGNKIGISEATSNDERFRKQAREAGYRYIVKCNGITLVKELDDVCLHITPAFDFDKKENRYRKQTYNCCGSCEKVCDVITL